MKKLGLLLVFIMAICSTNYGQSKVVKTFEESADGYKGFAYQSMLRLLNRDKNPEFNNLIKDLDHIRLASTKQSPRALTSFRDLDAGIQTEGFELLMTFDNADYKFHIYELSSKSKKSTWVATFLLEGRAGVLEMVGSLNVKYLTALSSVNFDQLKELVPGIENFENTID